MDKFIINLDKFIKKIEQSDIIDSKDFTEFKINIKTSDITNIPNNNRCLAIVESIDRENYQCTRKSKFGGYCGIHYERKNLFRNMEPNTEIRDIKTFYIILKPKNKEKNNNSSSYVFDFIDDEVFRIDYMNNNYRINKNTHDIWFEDENNLVYIGKLENTKIPIVLY